MGTPNGLQRPLKVGLTLKYDLSLSFILTTYV